MKFSNQISLALVFVIIISSCSGTRESRTMQRAIRGSWSLQTIVTEGQEKLKDKLFNEAEFSCFIGSEWNFSKNGVGSYMLVDKHKTCPEIKRLINWTYVPAGITPATVKIQRLNDKNEPVTGESFTLVINQLDNATMKLRAEQLTEVNPTVIVYNFVRK